MLFYQRIIPYYHYYSRCPLYCQPSSPCNSSSSNHTQSAFILLVCSAWHLTLLRTMFTHHRQCKMTRNLGIFTNLKMFAVFKLQYLRQYVKLIYIFTLLTSSRIHTYITHTYQHIFFRYVKLSTRKFEVNYENYM